VRNWVLPSHRCQIIVGGGKIYISSSIFFLSLHELASLTLKPYLFHRIESLRVVYKLLRTAFCSIESKFLRFHTLSFFVRESGVLLASGGWTIHDAINGFKFFVIKELTAIPDGILIYFQFIYYDVALVFELLKVVVGDRLSWLNKLSRCFEGKFGRSVYSFEAVKFISSDHTMT